MEIDAQCIGSHAPGQNNGRRRKCWKMKLSENDHASSVVQNTKRIVHVFRVSVVIMMIFVATNVCVATATRLERLLKRNGQPTSTTTSMSLQAGRKHRRIFLLVINYIVSKIYFFQCGQSPEQCDVTRTFLVNKDK